MEKIPIWEKQNLTISEAAQYSNIGEKRLYALTDMPDCPFLLRIGNKRLIKKEQFDIFINSCHEL